MRPDSGLFGLVFGAFAIIALTIVIVVVIKVVEWGDALVANLG